MHIYDIIAEIKNKGSEQINKILLKHGAKEPLYGLKVAEPKIIPKKIKKNNEPALALFDHQKIIAS